MEGITVLTPFKMHKHTPVSLFRNSSSFCSMSSFVFYPSLLLPQFDRWNTYPGCPLTSPESFFPRVETLASFFSPSSPPLPPFISVKWLPKGKRSSPNNVAQVSQRGRSEVQINLLFSTGSLSPSTSYPSLSPPLSCPNINPPTLSAPVPAEGGGRGPSPSQRNFPVEMYINFRDASSFIHSVWNVSNSLLPLTSPFHSFPFKCSCLFLSPTVTRF